MSLKISNNSLVAKNYIVVDSGGVHYCYNTLLGGEKRMAFSQIDCILMSADHKLSIHMGSESYSIQVNPNDPKHQAVINALLQEVRRTALPPGGG